MSTPTIAMAGLLEAEYFDFNSSIVRDTFRIFVAKPPFVQGGKHPAIYVTDGNGSFPLTMAIQRMLAFGAETPPAFVIGVGYPTEEGYMQAISKRNRDYPPTDGGDYSHAILGSSVRAAGNEFLQFIRDELKPELERRYAIDPGDATYIGASLGGLFGAWTLLTAPETFQRYILASPSISWNDEEVWKWERAYSEVKEDMPATVFVSAGGLEAAEPARRHALQMIERVPMLRAQLESIVAWFDQHGWPRTTELPTLFAETLRSRRYPNLKILAHNLPEETHMSVSPAAISRGLRYVFGSWQAQTE